MVEEIFCETRAEWRNWLAENYATSKGVFLVINKKSSDKSHLAYNDSVQEALCFGWIDSVANTVDAERSKRYFSPRKPKSNWSRLNKSHIAELMTAGLMTEAGLKMVELAKKTGTWMALDGVEDLVVPDDLAAALKTVPIAEQYFNAFPRSPKRAILEWLLNAKTSETRQKRINETVTLAAQNIRAHQYVKKT